MAEVSAYSKNLRISSKKLGLVAKSFRGLKAKDAYESLRFVPKKAATPLAKTIKSAIANAEKNFGLKVDDLVIKEILVEQGTTLKRYRPASRGMAHHILKRTSNLKVVLAYK